MQKNSNIVKAINKNLRSSPRKVNLLLKNIRGKKVDLAGAFTGLEVVFEGDDLSDPPLLCAAFLSAGV